MMCRTLVVNKRFHVATANDVYIGRPSMVGNPFAIGPYGNREEVIAKFEHHARERIKTDKVFREYVKGLHGRTLVCWCKPQACHGDVLVQLSKELQS